MFIRKDSEIRVKTFTKMLKDGIVKSIETRCSMQAKVGDVTVLGVFGGVEREEE